MKFEVGARVECVECGYEWRIRIPEEELKGERKCPKCGSTKLRSVSVIRFP